MEVSQASKQLHRHALPITGLLVVLLLISAATLAYLRPDFSTERTILNKLTNSVIKIDPGQSGLIKMHVEKNEPATLSEVNQLGRSTDISFSLNVE